MQRGIGMLIRILATLAAVAVATLVQAETNRGPWPSESFDRPERANVAGEFDYYTLVMSWSPTHCLDAEHERDDAQCARRDGLRYGFLLHGLWPQFERGYPERCRVRGRPFVPEPVINQMLDIMPNKGLIIHEYREHGTCSGLNPGQYYALARQLFSRVRIPKRFENPSESQFVAPRDLLGEFLRANPGLKPDMIAIGCGGGNRLRDVRICLTRDGRPRSCGQNENRGQLCRAQQMFVPPVRSRDVDRRAPPRAQDLPAPRVLEGPGAL
jgi:ribonuclease T2